MVNLNYILFSLIKSDFPVSMFPWKTTKLRNLGILDREVNIELRTKAETSEMIKWNLHCLFPNIQYFRKLNIFYFFAKTLNEQSIKTVFKAETWFNHVIGIFEFLGRLFTIIICGQPCTFDKIPCSWNVNRSIDLGRYLFFLATLQHFSIIFSGLNVCHWKFGTFVIEAFINTCKTRILYNIDSSFYKI